MKPITIGSMIQQLLSASLTKPQRDFVLSSAESSDYGATTSKLSDADVERIDALYSEVYK
jgi:hypothetical protein